MGRELLPFRQGPVPTWVRELALPNAFQVHCRVRLHPARLGQSPNSGHTIASTFRAEHDSPIPPQFKNHPPLVPYEDANRDNKPYNQGYYGFDPTSQYVGKYTVLDQIHNSTMKQNADGLSNNPMDPNWGGAVFTEEKVESGLYEGNNVQPPTVQTVLQS